MHKTLCFFFSFLLTSLVIQAQESAVFNTDLLEFKRGLDLLEKEKYGAAQRQFALLLENKEIEDAAILGNATYYYAICAINLFNRDADFQLREFIRNYPESPLVMNAYFQLGNFNYRKKDWRKSIEWFQKVDAFELTSSEYSEYYFKFGYAYFEQNDFENALKKFFEIKDTDNGYFAPANYYYAHINYEQKNWETAFIGFKKLENHPKFKEVVPYYLTQILYQQSKFDELLAYAPQLIDSVSEKRKGELARLIGDAYYEKQQYTNAIPFLEIYSKKARNLTKEDRYQLGYAYFKSNNCEKAIDLLSSLARHQDELAQTSLYHLGECYLKQENKAFARNAFYEAYVLGFDEKINEDALYKFAVLSYEIQYDPYNSAIKAFTDYIELYPGTERTDQSYKYLLNVYLTSKNFDKALQSIDKIKTLDLGLKGAYQLIAYNKATKLFSNSEWDEAISYYEKSQRYAVDEKLNALSEYWIGESFYQKKKYAEAAVQYDKFIFSPRAILTDQFKRAHYNLGYAYFKQKEYNNALKWYRKYITLGGDGSANRLADAHNRAADCFFVDKQYAEAINYYEDAYAMNDLDPDYSIFQKAIAEGIMKQSNKKISSLELMLEKFPNSVYADAAHYELGRSFVLKNQEEKGLPHFIFITDSMTESAYMKQALVNKGLIYYNQHKNNEALDIFKRIVNEYPTYNDTKEALLGIRNIYVEMGNVDAYESYIAQLDFIDISQATLDSTTFESAELRYIDKDYKNAATAFEKYLERFSPAIFDLKAHFYMADALYTVDEKAKALPAFEYVANKPINKFSEMATEASADLNFEFENFEKAELFYLKLLKVAGQKNTLNKAQQSLLEIYKKTENHEKTIEMANRVLTQEKLPEQLFVRSNFYIADALLKQDFSDSSIAYFQLVSDTTKTILAAESNFRIAEIYYNKKDFQKAEEQIFKLVNSIPSYSFWIAKGLILLADIYFEMSDYFQAKATLKSIIDNYEGEDLVAEAQERYDAILELEKPEPLLPVDDRLEIDFESNDGLKFNADELFEEEEVLDEF